MASRLGASVKSARERLGWSRETLAHRSGLSWAAIAQIESGRRREVRASSLVALSSALDVSVDYLVGGATTVHPGLLNHRLATYGGDDEYLTEFRDAGEWYQSLPNAAGGYLSYVQERFAAGASWIRIIGEPVWAGHSDDELAAWFRYEALINLAFASSPATVVCTYDTRVLPLTAMDDARRTHPQLTNGGEVTASPAYRAPEERLLSLG
jgi:transcriptional regulator with XRE-family HTH domain